MNSIIKYITDVYKGVISLLTGLKVTGKYFFSPKEIVTQQYPENRIGKNTRTKKKLEMFERFKGEIVMPHNDKNEHKCTGCGICEINCPNGTIEVISQFRVNEEGKKKRELDKHIYHLGMCTFCGLCIKNCPSTAIAFSQEFEHAVFDRSKLTKILNKEGSTLMKGVE
ncbi:MAG: 4Fe-4S binding protein [Lentimicrobiaceae bacterium]|jgi:NADH-quinone oxidoreductase subunit I|nr:4Fe-4S binding protein [Lentimicrobiaceae bacterium]